jgi:hypothetical protein
LIYGGTDARKPSDESATLVYNVSSSQTFVESQDVKSTPILALDRRSHHGHVTELLEQWEGTVLSIGPGDFTARLRSINSPDEPEEQASFELEIVPDADRDLFKIGAVFYWSVGYQKKPNGQKSLMSEIRFRRLAAWTSSDAERARRTADTFRMLFYADPGDSSRT